MSKYINELFATGTPQSNAVPSSVSTAKQSPNNAGGYTFELSPLKRLERFLVLGSERPTYYATASKLTKDNAACVVELWEKEPMKIVSLIRDVSFNALAPKNSPAIFALALGMTSTNVVARKLASTAVNDVCRTSTHLFEFVETCMALKKGFGRIMKRTVANWYKNKSDEQLAYQLVKYRQRNGFTHERLIRLSHPKHEILSPSRSAMYDWLRGRNTFSEILPDIIRSHELAMAFSETETDAVVNLAYDLPWEALPTWANTKAEVWRAMLPKMGLTALLRNLGNMTRIGVFNDAGISFNVVDTRLRDDNELMRARIHPYGILLALRTYESGRGFKGSNTWTPYSPLLTTLEEAFYKSFKFIVPSNKRLLLALDVSGSMGYSHLQGGPISAREASAAMAMATLRTEENVAILGFTSLYSHNMGNSVSPLQINKGMPLNQVVDYTSALSFGATDCSLPMLFALEHQLNVDAFVIYTDNETWAGRIQPVEALRRYREKSGIHDAKLIVVGMTSTGFSIADPNDPWMLDVVGFDASAPSVIANFIAGKSPEAPRGHVNATEVRTRQEELKRQDEETRFPHSNENEPYEQQD